MAGPRAATPANTAWRSSNGGYRFAQPTLRVAQQRILLCRQEHVIGKYSDSSDGRVGWVE